MKNERLGKTIFGSLFIIPHFTVACCCYCHSRRRSQIPSAQRSARAPMVEVGFTAALVVNELPSTIKRFLT